MCRAGVGDAVDTQRGREDTGPSGARGDAALALAGGRLGARPVRGPLRCTHRRPGSHTHTRARGAARPPGSGVSTHFLLHLGVFTALGQASY